MSKFYFIKNKIIVFWLKCVGDMIDEPRTTDVYSSVFRVIRDQMRFCDVWAGKNTQIVFFTKKTPFIQVHKSIKYCEMMQCS